MKVKFLVPEIDRKRFSEELSYKRKLHELELKDFERTGIKENTESIISQYCTGKKFPTMWNFISICRFLNTPPDYFLFAKPKWIECDLDDISYFSVLGKHNDTYYIVPSKGESAFLYRCTFSINNELKEEPDPNIFSDLSIYGTRYDFGQKRKDGIVTYKHPVINEQKTSDKIFSLLKDINFSEEQVQKLLSLSASSINNRRNIKYNNWTIKDLYKLSLILNRPFEDFLELEESNEQTDSIFDDDLFLEQCEEWSPPYEDKEWLI